MYKNYTKYDSHTILFILESILANISNKTKFVDIYFAINNK